MVTVDVYAYTDEFGENEDFVIHATNKLFPLCASKDDADRLKVALRCARDGFVSMSVNENMDENAKLIATLTFTEEEVNANR